MGDDLDVEKLLEESLNKTDEKKESHTAENGNKRDDNSNSKHSSKDNDRERDKERRDRERDRDRGEKRRRSKSRSRDRKRRRTRSRSRDKHRRSSRSRDRAERHRRSSRSKSRDKHRRRSRSRGRTSTRTADGRDRSYRGKSLERSKSPLVDDSDRDLRTVFVTNMPVKAREREIYEFFLPAGKVRDVRLITDRNSRKSKGLGYVEFYEMSAVDRAITLSGRPFMGKIVNVQPTQAEKNRAAASAQGPLRLYVGNLHVNVTEDELRKIFEPYGELDFVSIQKDVETARSRGYGFIQFRKTEDGKRAMAQVNGHELMGKQLRLNAVTETGSKSSGSEMSGAAQPLNDLDDEGGGVALNAKSRVLLMAKLQRDEAIDPLALMTAPPINSACIVLKNMFDPATEDEPDFDREIRDDVEEECAKFGPVLHIFVDKNSAGNVYVKFQQPDAARQAAEAMNGRWFAGRQLGFEYIPQHVYNDKFRL
jgi:RNA-binding protein 39